MQVQAPATAEKHYSARPLGLLARHPDSGSSRLAHVADQLSVVVLRQPTRIRRALVAQHICAAVLTCYRVAESGVPYVEAWSRTMSHRVIRINDLASRPNKPGLLPVSPATLWRWVQSGRFPKPYKLGPATTVWDPKDVEAFLAQQKAVEA